MVWENGFGKKMHGCDNKRVERDEIVNRVPPTLFSFVTNNNKLIQFIALLCMAKIRQSPSFSKMKFPKL